MRKATLCFCFLLVAGVVMIASERTANAQAGGMSTFKWKQFKGADNKMYDYPSWSINAANVKQTVLSGADAEIYLATGTTLKKVEMKVYKPAAGIPMGWVLFATINFPNDATRDILDGPNAVVGFPTIQLWNISTRPTDAFYVADINSNIRIDVKLTCKQGNQPEYDVVLTSMNTTAVPH